MPTDSKCIHWSCSENLNGKPIVLTILQHDRRTLEIVVKYMSQENSYRKYIFLFLIILLNVLSFIYDIISTKYCIIIFAIVLVFVYNILYTVQQERILIAQYLGYQIEVRYRFGKVVRYVAWETIKSVFVNEVISRHRVIFILSLLTKETAKEAIAIIPLFLNTLPRLQCLEVIYQYADNCHCHD